jgi:hypothetical protein
MSWSKIKGLFVEDAGGGSADVDAVLEDLQKYQVPEPAAALPRDVDRAQLSGQIDFQALYDQAGIPNTDEVESLERFLTGLDSSLPQASRLTAAKAFLGAVGKSPDDVLTDAARKIAVVRAVGESKRTDTQTASAQRQQAIAELQRQIDEHRSAVQELERDLESVRAQCATEEARLQGARVFFGHLGGVEA